MRPTFTFLLLTIIGISLFSCSNTNSDRYMDGDLVHTVIISLKKDLSSNQKEFVVSLLASLENIPETKGLFVAEKANTNDSRAKEDYDIILQMAFNNEEDLAIYSTDKYHLSIRDQLKQFLSGPPVVYDYRVK